MSRCQQENAPQAKFCMECGAPISGATNAAESSAELKARIEGLKRSLNEAAEQLAATSEILRVISNSPTDVQPVFDTILASAARLCDAHRGALLLFKNGAFETGAELGAPTALSAARRTPYRPDARSVLWAVCGAAGGSMSFVWVNQSAGKQILRAVCDAPGRV